MISNSFEELMQAFGPESLSRNTTPGSSGLASSAFVVSDYPQTNTVRIDKTNYVIEMAVPGFLGSDLDVERIGNLIKVTGDDRGHGLRDYTEKGFQKKSFIKNFRLKRENSLVKKVTLFNGVLTIYIEDVVPEAEKPKKINIEIL